MTDIANAMANLRRPRLLIRAARIGMAEYRRERDLAGLVTGNALPAPRQAVDRLMTEEARIEETRRSGAAGYSISRHVEVLIALMAEAQLLLASARPRSA